MFCFDTRQGTACRENRAFVHPLQQKPMSIMNTKFNSPQRRKGKLNNFLGEKDTGRHPPKNVSDASTLALFTVDESETSVQLEDMFPIREINKISPLSPKKYSGLSSISPLTPKKHSGLSSYLTKAQLTPNRKSMPFGNNSLQSVSLDSSFSSSVYECDDDTVTSEKEEESSDTRRGKRALLAKQDTYRQIPTFTWRRESTIQNGQRKVNFVPVEDDGNDHDICLKDLRKHRLLGEGMFGQVWLVSSKSRPYAVKVQSKFELAEGAKIEFAVREKEIMSKMKHPFIIRLVKAYQDSQFIYLIMDFVKGGELWSLLHPCTDNVETVTMPERQAKFYTLCLADAIVYIHNHKYIFRDIKPENILIDAAGYPVLVDFGLAKRLERGEKTYTTVGTPAYCSPEIINGSGHTRCTDYWSLGILTYEMLMGTNPFSFEGIDRSSLYLAITEDEYQPMKNTSEDAIDFVRRMLIKDPIKRLGARSPKDVLKHEWFDDFDLTAIRRRKIKAPWVPEISDPLDSSHFDDWSDLDDKSTQTFPEIEHKDDTLFDSFPFTSDPLQ